MANAYALLVGLKSVDPAAYNRWDGTNGCWGCELDVDNMTRILNSQGYQTKSLKTEEATHDNILSSLYRAAENTVPGDVFVFYYSGHGGQQPDFSGDELDGEDETLVAYDREIVDDKIHNVLRKFKNDVHIAMISDSCNSGSNYRGRKDISVKEDSIFRPIARSSAEGKVEINAQLIHLGGCRDGSTSAGYYGGGAFTMALCEAWNNGEFSGTYKNLHSKICELIRSDQKPQYSEYGPVADAFRNQKAFSSIISLSLQEQKDKILETISVLEKQSILNPSILKIVKEEIEKKFVSIKELEERVLARLQKEGYLSQDKLIGALAVGAIIIGSILYSSPAY